MVSRGVFAIPPGSSGGGAELHAYYLSSALAVIGNKVTLVSRTREGLKLTPGLKVTTIPFNNATLRTDIGFIGWVCKHLFGSIFVVFAAQRELSRNGKIRIIHCHGSLVGLALRLLNRHRHVVYTVHDLTPWQGNYPFLFERCIRKISFMLFDRYLWTKADAVIAVAPALRSELARFGVKAQQFEVISNGVRPRDEPPVRTNNSTTSGFGLFVGQVSVRKGIRFLCDALENIDARVVVVGDGPELSEARKVVVRRKLQEKVKFTGYLPWRQLREVYSDAGYFVMPSLSDAFPTLSMLDAMAFGLPVVCPNLGADSNLISNGVTGFVFSRGDVKGLSAALDMLSSDVKLRKNLGDNAKKVVFERCSWNEIARATTRVYEALSTVKS